MIWNFLKGILKQIFGLLFNMTDLLNKPLVEKVSFLIYNIFEHQDGTFTINENNVYHHFMDDPDIDIIFEKINKLMKLMLVLCLSSCKKDEYCAYCSKQDSNTIMYYDGKTLNQLSKIEDKMNDTVTGNYKWKCIIMKK